MEHELAIQSAVKQRADELLAEVRRESSEADHRSPENVMLLIERAADSACDETEWREVFPYITDRQLMLARHLVKVGVFRAWQAIA